MPRSRLRAVGIGALCLGAVAAPAQAQQPSLADVVQCTGAAASSPFCRDRTRAIDAQGRFASVYERLAATAAPPWNAEDLNVAGDLAKEADTLMNDQYFGDALQRYDRAMRILEELEATLDRAVEAERQQAARLAESGDFQAAEQRYQKLLLWRPGDAAAMAALGRARQDAELGDALRRAQRDLDLGQTDAAEALLLSIDESERNARWNALMERIAAPRREARFQSFVNEAMRLREQEKWQAAEAALKRALGVKPGSQFARDALDETLLLAERARRRGLEERLRLAAEAEDWHAALAAQTALLPMVGDRQAAEDHIALLTGRIELERQIDGHVATARQGVSAPRRRSLKAFLDELAEVEAGARIDGKVAALQETLQAWSEPILVSLTSDKKTTVRVRPGRSLGTFDDVKLHMLPGRYRISGVRKGYRETLYEIELAPGQAPVSLAVICDEKF